MTQPAKRIPDWLTTDLLVIVVGTVNYRDLDLDCSLSHETVPPGVGGSTSVSRFCRNRWDATAQNGDQADRNANL